MKIMKLKEGVIFNGIDYTFDFGKDSESDIINLTLSDLYKSTHLDNVYYFGYKFSDNVDRIERSKFIRWLKELKEPTSNVESFIIKPIKELDRQEDLGSFSCMLYPKSGRSELMNIIISTINKYLPRDLMKKPLELVKKLPDSVLFDWNSFDSDFTSDIQTYKQIKEFVNKELIPNIHKLSYFSLADNVKPKYRKYITNYLTFDKEEYKDILESINTGKILILDDIFTSGSTVDEIIRLVKSINSQCEIYIFTIIGKE